MKLNAFLSSVTGALQITGSDVNDQGKYECVANNSVGTEYSKSAMLYVKGTQRFKDSIVGPVSRRFKSREIRLNASAGKTLRDSAPWPRELTRFPVF